MNIDMMIIFRALLYAFLLGVFFCVAYDLLRLTRVMMGVSYAKDNGRAAFIYKIKFPLIGYYKKNNNKLKTAFVNTVIFIEDLIYFSFLGIAFSVFVFYANEGKIRISLLISAILGFLVYFNTFGRLFVSFFEIIANFLKIFIKIFVFSIAFPIKIVYNIISRFLVRAFGRVYGFFYFKIQVRKSNKLMLNYKKSAADFFLKFNERT